MGDEEKRVASLVRALFMVVTNAVSYGVVFGWLATYEANNMWNDGTWWVAHGDEAALFAGSAAFISVSTIILAQRQRQARVSSTPHIPHTARHSSRTKVNIQENTDNSIRFAKRLLASFDGHLP